MAATIAKVTLKTLRDVERHVARSFGLPLHRSNREPDSCAHWWRRGFLCIRCTSLYRGKHRAR